MQNFFTPPKRFSPGSVMLEGEECRHAARVCRVRMGEIIGVTDGRGRRVEARVTEIGRETLEASIERDVSGRGEPETDITLALALIKPSRFEAAVEQCTELGVRGIVPVRAERCERESRRIRNDRLARIALEAAKQSARSWIPEIADATGIEEVCGRPGLVLAAVMGSREPVRDAIARAGGVREVTVVIGPEGDFTPEETEYMISHGTVPVTLGGLTLRAETAAVTAVVLVRGALG